MSGFEAAVLGIIQGLTEFLPVSSSAHLVLVPRLLGWPEAGLAFSVFVHSGTLVAVIAFFMADLRKIVAALVRWRPARAGKGAGGNVNGRGSQPNPDNPENRETRENHEYSEDAKLRRLAVLLILATVPTGLVYLAIGKVVEAAFESPVAASLFLLVTAALLLLAEALGKMRRGLESIGPIDGILIGLAQGLALFPGISRSGSTMSMALFRGIDRESAARFSFLLAIPIIMAGTVLEAIDFAGKAATVTALVPIAIGFIAAAVSGYLAIRYLLEYLRKGSLRVFAYYCIVAGIGSFLLQLVF